MCVSVAMVFILWSQKDREKSKSVCLSAYLSIYLSIYLFVCLSTYLSIYLSVNHNYFSIPLSLSCPFCVFPHSFHPLSVCLSVCLSIYLSINLSVYLSFIHITTELSPLVCGMALRGPTQSEQVLDGSVSYLSWSQRKQ